MESRGLHSATSQLQMFLSSTPPVKMQISGMRRTGDFMNEDKEETIFSVEIPLDDNLHLEEKADSQFLLSLSDAARAFDSRTRSKYKTFSVEKRATLPFEAIKILLRERLQTLLPHFFDRFDCRLVFKIVDNVQQLKVQGGSRQTAGQCADQCCTPCLSDPVCISWLVVFGCHGVCALSQFCCRREEFVAHNNNVVHFIGPDEQWYWKAKIDASLVPDQFRSIHI
jgi:hypothetical protein